MNKLVSTDPSKNYEEIGSVTISTKEEVKNNVLKAQKAYNEWRKLSVKERVNLLQSAFNKLYRRKKEISQLVSEEMGFPIKNHVIDIEDGFHYFKWYLDNAEEMLSEEVTFESDSEIHKVVYEPYGVAAVISPWNYPFGQWVWQVVPTLVAGNTVVFKHSEECSLTGELIADIIETSKLPHGVFNEVYGNGDVGRILLDQDINLVGFTGSTKTGREIYQKASEKMIKVLMELGGSAPGIIFEDADLDSAIEHVFDFRFYNSGQVCDGLKRLIVHESIVDKVVDELKKLVESKKVGISTDESSDFGPLVAERQLKLVEEQYKDAVEKGAVTVIGGKRPGGLSGAYFEPTLLTNITTEMRVWKEEVFGPILPVVTFNTEEEAIKLANDTQYGLGGYVYTKDLEKAERVAREIETGMVSINGVNYVCPHNPFGGNVGESWRTIC